VHDIDIEDQTFVRTDFNGKKYLYCSIILGALGMWYSHQSLPRSSNKRSGATDIQTKVQTRQYGDSVVKSIEFSSNDVHGKHNVLLPDINFASILSYSLCCSSGDDYSIQCDELGWHRVVEGPDLNSSVLEFLPKDDRNLASKCRIVVWQK
jgi:hypothetical protein